MFSNFVKKLSSRSMEQQQETPAVPPDWVDVTEPTSDDDGDVISARVTTAKNKYSYNNQHQTTAAISLVAREVDFSQRERKALDLVVVLDKSGSMAGEKLDLCKSTIRFLLSQLQAKDKFALVLFDTMVETYEFEVMTDQGKAKMTEIVENVRDGSATNLSGGLFQGTQLMMNLREQGKHNEIQSVLLLTDGMANNGITETHPLVAELKKQISDMPALSIFTFGYGDDHNDEMLRAISDQTSGGVYYYVEDEEAVSAAFGSCLGGLLSVVAQNITVTLTNEAAPGMALTKVCTKGQVEELESGRVFATGVGDQFSGEKKDLLVKLCLEPVEGPTTQTVRVLVSYHDVLAERERTLTVALEVLRASSDEGAVHDLDVVTATNRVTAAEALDEAARIAREGALRMGGGRGARGGRRMMRHGPPPAQQSRMSRMMGSMRRGARAAPAQTSNLPPPAMLSNVANVQQQQQQQAPPTARQAWPSSTSKCSSNSRRRRRPRPSGRCSADGGGGGQKRGGGPARGARGGGRPALPRPPRAGRRRGGHPRHLPAPARGQHAPRGGGGAGGGPGGVQGGPEGRLARNEARGQKTMSSYAQGHWKQRHNRAKKKAFSDQDRTREMYQNVTSFQMQACTETFVKANKKGSSR
ncbi:unnamed protein product [Heterosigma akashiwo]